MLLTCIVYSNISVASFFSFIYLRFFIDIYFGFEETKLTKGKLYVELRPVLK